MTNSVKRLLAWSFFAVALSACGGSQHPGDSERLRNLLPVGSQVPALTRMDHSGQAVSLRSDAPTLIYFYPRDGTPGCTREACSFRDAWHGYRLSSLRVIGVSSDTDASHRAFAEEHRLPFSLIADPENAWSNAFGVGSFDGVDERVSFLVDANGRIVKVYENVDPGVHADQVLNDAETLGLLR